MLFRSDDVGDVTLFVSNNFMTGFGGASVLGLSKNSIYFSEPVDGPQEDQDHELEISDIHNGTSELLCYHNQTQSRNVSPALCWIQPKPNPWTTEGTYIHICIFYQFIKYIFHVCSCCFSVIYV